MREATFFEDEAKVVHNREVQLLKPIYDEVIDHTDEENPIRKGKIYQFFVEVTEVMVGAKIKYGKSPQRPAKVIFIDDEIKRVNFLGNIF